MKRFFDFLTNLDPVPIFLALLGLAVSMAAGAPAPGSVLWAAFTGSSLP